MALARFEATENLIKVGANQFKETTESGQPLMGKPKTSGRGSLMTKSLEASNTDLAKEFVDMIKAQRGFQASAKSISSANEMLEEVINLRRT
jgi:flagellar hook protein FlgE